MIIKYKTKKTPLKRGGCNIMNLNVRFYILKTTSYSMSLILIHAPNINTFFEITTIFGSLIQ